MAQGAALHANPKYPDDARAQGMRGYASGGAICARPKVKQPGYAKSGKVMLPEDPGPIGDVAEDTGEDTQEVLVRDGEYLLNPETVEFIGEGDYENGVRSLDQLVMQATGEEPGPELVEQPGGEQLGFANNGQVPRLDQFGRPISGTAPVIPMSAEAAAAQGGTVRTPPPPDFVNDTTQKGAKPTPKAGLTAKQMGELQQNAKRMETYRKVGSAAGTSTKAVKNALGALSGLRYLPFQAAAISPVTGFGDYDIDPAREDTLFSTENAANAALDATSGVAGFVDDVSPFIPGMPNTNYEQALAERVARHGADAQVWDPETQSLVSNAPITPQFNDVGGDTSAAGDAAVIETDAPARASFISPQGEVYSEGFPDPVGNYIANNAKDADVFGQNPVNAGNLRQIPGAPGTQYAGQYGGQEVVVTQGANGEPVFTGLRTPQQVAESAARSQQVQAPPSYEEQLDAQIQAVESGARQVPTRVYESMLSNRQRLEEAKYSATGRAATTTDQKMWDATEKRIAEQFNIPQYNDEGEVTSHIPDPEMKKVFDETLVQLAPAIMKKYGQPFHRLNKTDQSEIFADFDGQYKDTMLAKNSMRQQNLPVDNTFRSGANRLRRVKGSNIGLGDVLGPEATMGDWWRGVVNPGAEYDEFLEDPRNENSRIPAYKGLRNRGNSARAYEDYGYLE